MPSYTMCSVGMRQPKKNAAYRRTPIRVVALRATTGRAHYRWARLIGVVVGVWDGLGFVLSPVQTLKPPKANFYPTTSNDWPKHRVSTTATRARRPRRGRDDRDAFAQRGTPEAQRAVCDISSQPENH